MRLLRRIAPSGVRRREDYERYLAREREEAAKGTLKSLQRHDRNGDGRITEAEYEREFPKDTPNPADRFAYFARRADSNGDRVIDREALAGYADRLARGRLARQARHAAAHSQPFAFDLNGDDRITESEIREAVQAAVTEIAVLRPAQGGKGTPCAAPVPPPDMPIVLLSGHEGAGISTVAVDGLDRETSVSTVIVEAGETPLYVLAASAYPTIWKLSGAVDRIVAFIVAPAYASLGPGGGVVGLPAGKVGFVPSRSCLKSFSDAKSGDARADAREMGGHFRRDPETLILTAQYEVYDLAIPSGKGKRGRAGSYLGITFTDPNKQMGNLPPVPPAKAPPRESAAPRKAAEPARLPNSRRPPGSALPAVKAPGIGSRGGAAEPMRILAPARPEAPSRPAAAPAPPRAGAGSGKRSPDLPAPAPPAAAGASAVTAQALEKLRKELVQHYPAGLIEIDPAEVVAPTPVRPYDVLPAQAGMIRLVESGAFHATDPETFVLVEPIPRFPSGLSLSPTMKILIGKGIPRPAGSADRVRVLEAGEQ